MDTRNFNFDEFTTLLAQQCIFPAIQPLTGKMEIRLDQFFSSAEMNNRSLLNAIGELAVHAVHTRYSKLATKASALKNPTGDEVLAILSEAAGEAHAAVILLAIIRRSLRDVKNDDNFRKNIREAAEEMILELGFIDAEARSRIRANVLAAST